MPRRRTRLALTRSLRGLMALLWLAASLAYLTREQTVVTGPGSVLTNLMSSSMSMTSDGDAHTADQMEMPAGPPEAADLDASQKAKSASVQPPHHQQTHHANAPPAPSAPNHHAGHCPFCFTAAFALAVAAADLPPASPRQAPAVAVCHVAAPRLSAADHDARAPPFSA